MPTSGRSAARRAGQVGRGLVALIVLIGLLVGAPAALVALAGNPLPDHVPGLDEITTTLTSRDDGQLFLRALAIVGWVGWATFALSVLVELPARALRRPALRLPGLGRQQRAAAALLGSVALILVASPAATAAASVAAPVAATAPHARPVVTAPHARPVAAEPALASGPAPAWLAHPERTTAVPEPVYRVERDDYLGYIADRYLGDFDRYRELAKLNKIRDADRIRPGQLLHLPEEAADHGVRDHATGLVATPPPPGGWPAEEPGYGPPMDADLPSDLPASRIPSGQLPPDEPAAAEEHGEVTTFTYRSSDSGELGGLNRPLAVSAVIATAGMVGAQIGAVLGLRRRPAPGRPGGSSKSAESGRHRLRD